MMICNLNRAKRCEKQAAAPIFSISLTINEKKLLEIIPLFFITKQFISRSRIIYEQRGVIKWKMMFEVMNNSKVSHFIST